MDPKKSTSSPDVVLSRVIVIGGMPRSGTNLARRLIGSHSQVAVPPAELHYHARIAGGWSVEQILSEPKFLSRYKPAVEDLIHLDSDAVYRHLLARYAASKGKPIAGEKSPHNEFHYRDMRRCLAGSDLRFIHMVRNPFDVVASYKNAPFRGANPHNEMSSLETIARDWVRSVGLAAARTLMLPDSYRLIRFEDLTNDTATVTEDVCRFLGLEFERDRMLNFSDYQGQADNTSFVGQHSSGSDMGPKVKQLDSRKSHLSEAEILAVGRICGEIAQAIGYDDPDFDRARSYAPMNSRSPGYFGKFSRRFVRRLSRKLASDQASTRKD